MALTAKEAEFHKKAQEIAVWLGLEYEKESEVWVRLKSEDQDRAITLHYRGGDGSIGVHGTYPVGVDGETDGRRGLASYSDSLPSINCSMKRTAVDIGKDIQRRFFPFYDPIVAKCRQQDVATRKWRAEREAAVQQLVNSCPVVTANMKEHKIDFYETDVGSLHGHAGMGVDLKFDYIDLVIAKKLLAIFYEYVKEKRASLAEAAKEPNASAV